MVAAAGGLGAVEFRWAARNPRRASPRQLRHRASHRSTLHGALVRGYDATLVSDAHTTEDLREWGFPVTPEQSIAYTNAYWSGAAAPGREGSVAPTAEVGFPAV